MRKTFILCVGAQKSGTTWLWKCISRHKAANFGMMKEYHVWDAISIPECAGFLVRLSDVLSFSRGFVPRLNLAKALRWCMQKVPGFYETHFALMARRHLRHHPGAEHFVTGDFTPSYCGLAPEMLTRVRQRLERKGFEVKVIFIMRDPVERCLSAVNMMHRTSSDRSSTEAELAHHFAAPAFALRTRYDLTAGSLDQSFAPDAILYLLYEELFSAQRIDDVSNHIGLKLDAQFVHEKHNAGPNKGQISEGLRQVIRSHYDVVYEFCGKRFPATRSIWR
jgi:hypothetical protein